MDMRAISLTQPWATAMALRPTPMKRIETRSWSTNYRGPLALHAAKSIDENVIEDARRLWPTVLWRECPRGAIIAIVDLVDCRLMEQAPNDLEEWWGNFGPGRYGWQTDNCRPLAEPVPCRGSLGVWTVPPDVADRVRAQLR